MWLKLIEEEDAAMVLGEPDPMNEGPVAMEQSSEEELDDGDGEDAEAASNAEEEEDCNSDPEEDEETDPKEDLKDTVKSVLSLKRGVQQRVLASLEAEELDQLEDALEATLRWTGVSRSGKSMLVVHHLSRMRSKVATAIADLNDDLVVAYSDVWKSIKEKSEVILADDDGEGDGANNNDAKKATIDLMEDQYQKAVMLYARANGGDIPGDAEDDVEELDSDMDPDEMTHEELIRQTSLACQQVDTANTGGMNGLFRLGKLVPRLKETYRDIIEPRRRATKNKKEREHMQYREWAARVTKSKKAVVQNVFPAAREYCRLASTYSGLRYLSMTVSDWKKNYKKIAGFLNASGEDANTWRRRWFSLGPLSEQQLERLTHINQSIAARVAAAEADRNVAQNNADDAE